MQARKTLTNLSPARLATLDHVHFASTVVSSATFAANPIRSALSVIPKGYFRNVSGLQNNYEHRSNASRVVADEKTIACVQGIVLDRVMLNFPNMNVVK